MPDPASDLLTMLSVTHCASLDVEPDEARRLADRLSEIHGDVHLANEASGWHLYLASPLLIARGQKGEIHKRNLAVNAARYFGWGDKYQKMSPRSRDKCRLCMKAKIPHPGHRPPEHAAAQRPAGRDE